MLTTYIFTAIIVLLIAWMSLWVTKKAYSRKWDE